MIELKRVNFISGEKNAISFGLSKILDFLDLSGRNIIFLSKPKNDVKTSLKYIVNFNKREFNNYKDFEDLVTNKSNLFRVDLIVVDLWEESVDSVITYKEMLDKTGLDFIIVSDKYHYIIGDNDVTVNRLEQDRNSDLKSIKFETKYYIKNEITNQKYSFDDYKLSYIRDKKINDLFGNNKK
jgi:hypothetical protein